MNKAICSLFAINPGEGVKTFQLSLLALLWSLATTLGFKYGDALFLLHVGSDSLPTIYSTVSCSMIGLAVVFVFAYHRFPITKVYLTLIFSGVLLYAFYGFCILNKVQTESVWIWYLIRVSASLFHYTAVTSFWNFADQYLSACAGRRLFGIFASSIFLGSTLSGFIMRSGAIPLGFVLLLISSILFITGSWILYVSSNLQYEQEDINEDDSQQQIPIQNSLKALLKAIATSRYTRLVLFGNFFAFLLWVIAEYNYMSTFERHFETEPAVVVGNESQAPLTLFLGQWYSVICFMNLFFGIFLYGRLIRRFGVGTLILFTPMMYLATFAGWLSSESLFFPLMGLFIVEGTTEITEDSNFNLLIKKGPMKVKSLVRVIAESFCEPLGMLTSSLILMIPHLDSRLFGLGLSFAAVTTAIIIRSNYYAPFKAKLQTAT